MLTSSIEGYFYRDQITSEFIGGWVWDSAEPEKFLEIFIYEQDTLVGSVKSNHYRGDLAEAGKGNGNHGFIFKIPFRLKDGKPHSLTFKVQTLDGELVDLDAPVEIETKKALPIATDEVMNVRFYTHYDVCNYSCEYCIAGQFDKKWVKLNSRWDENNYKKIVDKIAELPFKINLRLGVGGEFFTNNALIEGARKLSNSPNIHTLNMLTNLSFDKKRYERIFEGFDLKKIAVIASHHPTQIKNRKTWLESARYMNEKFDFCVIMVAYPAFIQELAAIKQELTENGIDVFVQGFIGSYEGKEYPHSYTAEEKALLKTLFYSRHDYEFFVNLKKPGLCNAGFKSIYIDIDGKVYNCGMGKPAQIQIGDMLKETPQIDFFDRPRPCLNDACLCDTENMNTLNFHNYYTRSGSNQHKYTYRFKELAMLYSEMDEWHIAY